MASKNIKRIRPIPYTDEDKAFLESLGKRINHLRIEKKLTQNDLAVMAGVHKNFICIVEKGIQNPSLMHLWHITNALDTTLSKLFDDW